MIILGISICITWFIAVFYFSTKEKKVESNSIVKEEIKNTPKQKIATISNSKDTLESQLTKESTILKVEDKKINLSFSIDESKFNKEYLSDITFKIKDLVNNEYINENIEEVNIPDEEYETIAKENIENNTINSNQKPKEDIESKENFISITDLK